VLRLQLEHFGFLPVGALDAALSGCADALRVGTPSGRR
jgi:hypothetical protein